MVRVEDAHSAMTYDEALYALRESLAFGIEPSLEGVRVLVDALGRPQDRFRTVQVAGTNGKTSTARLTAAILHEHGLHVGLYTSPHLVAYTERIEIDGKPISEEGFGAVVGDAVEAGRCLGERARAGETLPDGRPLPQVLTEFELLTAAALRAFDLAHVDCAVLEVGLGGRWDATSIVEPTVATITGIGLDHMHILGDTVEEIAGEKAAIIKRGSIPILGPGTAETTQVFMDRVASVDAKPYAVRPVGEVSPVAEKRTIRFSGATREGTLVEDVWGIHAAYPGLSMHAPSYQEPNIATAVATAEALLGRALDLDATRRGIDGLMVPGRFEMLSRDPLLIIDAAHNPESATALASAIRERFSRECPEGPTLLLGVLSDKDARGIVRALAPAVGRIVVSASDSPRRLAPERLADIVEEETGTRPSVQPTLAAALLALLCPAPSADVSPSSRPPTPLVASGSITVAGEVRGLVAAGLLRPVRIGDSPT